ncbi:MAG: geranylgeranylglyceryl/heptaprenylglyceryl phosphate synthase [Candidatus Diapherotrites archaeon]|uniref:Geranylgeranylglyceryl phosphate synthase n=1 Tax=Candidatus Iainarchaeum sp. TaxID=3101447 RepID=A0A8T3YJK6_9ARCH|nr:geranylgeranylglyceryl/heptaprenylglyceryl phosphate synthase [Candidatus Diapherotrites archaeon]
MNHFGKVYKQILKGIEEKGGLAFTVIDPPNQEPVVAGKIAKMAQEAGIDAIAVGGSVGAQGELLDHTILQVKENCSLPVILFPGNIASMSKHADAIYFMSMLNSLDPYYITGAQIAASAPVKRTGLEVIPTSYVIVEPGRAVGWVGRAQPVPRNLHYLAGITALAGQYMGSHLVILESGGGADSPAPQEMIAYTRKMIDVPLLIAGGVRNEKYAYDCIKAGGDIVHVGTAVENESDNFAKAKSVMQKIADAVKRAGREKRPKA